MKSNFWIKRGISFAACLVMISATTVAAAGNTRLIHSQGQYTLNSTEGPVIIDADDIEDNAEAIAALQGQLGGLSFRYGTEKDMGISDNEDKSYYWSKDTSGNWVKVGAVGTAVATDVLTGKKFSSEAGVDIPGSMPNPTSANVTYYNGGDNESSGATSTTPKVVTISNDTDTTASHTDNVSQINLGVNEQIIIPHGYYNKDIVIKNSVANRGSDIPDSGIIAFNGEYEAGYYPAFSVDIAVNNQIAALNAETMSCSGGTYTCKAQKEILSIQKFQASTWAQVAPGEGPGPENQYTHGWSCSGRLYIKRTDGTEETITQQYAGLSDRGYYGYAVNGLVELNQGDKLIAEYRGYMPLAPWTHSVSNNVSFQAYGVRFK